MDLYIVLGLARDASTGDIKRAYRRLARRFHPDINPGDRMAAAQFRRIAEAYETLSDAERRRRYDSGVPDAPSSDATFGFEGFDFSASAAGTGASTFGDLFADILQGRATGRPEAAPVRGADLHQSVVLSFAESMRGGQRSLTVTREERCRTCRGAGRLLVTEARCPHCQGAGHLRSVRGHMVFGRPCPRCGGTGRQRETPCPTCAGQGVEARTEALTIALPPGVADDTRVRVAGKGHAGRQGGPAGDLYVTAHVQPDPVFRREGDDLYVVVPVAIHEAALGSRIEVPSIEGPVRLRVPPGTQSGQRFRLRARGAPSPRDGNRGDLVVDVRLVLPKVLDERSKELLREFGRINHEDVRKPEKG